MTNLNANHDTTNDALHYAAMIRHSAELARGRADEALADALAQLEHIERRIADVRKDIANGNVRFYLGGFDCHAASIALATAANLDRNASDLEALTNLAPTAGD
ncbi:MAG: hypothetical protein M0R28_17640 [Pigmentiphaga sp.]|nr:hypothetical protein [Pigmentiphaga sp.]